MERSAAFQKGYFHVQDLSCYLACAALQVRPGLTVLDVCAAPGGKSFTLAEQMNMSRSNLHLKLKAITGKSAIDFIHKIRFNRACQLLQEGKYNVSEISFMVGYNTPSYFAARFKKYIGCLPTEYGKK